MLTTGLGRQRPQRYLEKLSAALVRNGDVIAVLHHLRPVSAHVAREKLSVPLGNLVVRALVAEQVVRRDVAHQVKEVFWHGR